MKGIGILLVVIYHSIGRNDVNALTLFNNGVFNVIASFFMQMFFVISGYLAYNKAGDVQWLKKHTLKWLLPILSFLLIYWFFSDMEFVHYIAYSLTYGFTGLVIWYLWCLILCYAVVHLLEVTRSKIRCVPLWVQAVMLLLILNLIPLDIFGVVYLKWYGIFFVSGYLLHHYQVNKRLAYATLVFFPLSVYLFDWMIPYQNLQYGFIGTALTIPAIMHGHTVLIGVMTLMAILGTAFIFSIADLIKWKPLVKVFSYLGSISIGIYLLHIMFVELTDNIYLSAFLATIISIILYEGLSRIKIFDRVLFGDSRVRG